ncbi:MAG: hypothetical protein ABL914_08315 [Novosphingobium sp.]|uniref:hypothetical protein n=1 Tax=Novosphingobium sp. TaxID=1874826 RepID=UPI0032BC9DF8
MRSWMMIAGLGLALAACQGEEKKATGGNASGEILPGSVSDAMLPLDTVKSQAPLAPKAEGSDKAESGAKAAVKPGKDSAKPAPQPEPDDAPEPKTAVSGADGE